MAQLKDTVITGDARVTGTLYAQEGTTTVPGLLSTADKTNLNNVVATSHSHSNKANLDAITATKMTNWDTAYSNSHTHSNKTALDAITSTKMTNWDNAATNSHTHSNKSALDAVTSTKMTNWDTAYSNSHTHSNKSALDAITSTKMTNWDNAATNSHTHSNKSVLDTVTSDVVNNSHTHSNKTALDAVTSTKMTNWDTAYSNSHSHSNKSALDAITSTKMTNWDNAATNSHTHSNKTALDAITSTKMTNWDTAYTNNHTHSNKTALDAITSTKMTNWDNAATNSHTHSNKANLDAITATKMTNWDTAYSNSHSHSNKAVLDTVTSAVVSNSHTHSNKTALDAITSTKMTNWDTAYSNSHSHTNKSVLDGISSTDVSNWNSKVPSTRTVNGKALSNDISLTANDLAPITTKTYTDLIGSANDAAGASFYFAKIQPTDYNIVWGIRYRIYVVAAGDSRAQQKAEVFITGSQSAVKSYAAFNSISNTSYRSAYYHNVYWATQAGITANKGHALGVGLRSSWNRTAAANKRTVTVELLETQNCTVTFLDTAVKYANWDGTGSTNYTGLGEYNFCDNGLQETGDANSNTWNYLQHYNTIVFKSAIIANSLIVGDVTGYVQAAAGVSFDITYPILWNHTARAANTNAYSDIYFMSYDRNIACLGITSAANKRIYLIITLNGITATIDSAVATDTLPSTEDGKLYMSLGRMGNQSTGQNYFFFDPVHPIFCYRDGKIRPYDSVADELSNIAYSGSLADGTGDSTHRLVTDTQITNWETAYANSHTHSNKSVLDTISSISQIAITGDLADGFDDSSHRLVTDLQIDTWNAKSNFSGAYSDLTGKPTIPTTLAQLSGDSTHRVVTDTQINTWTDAYTLPSGGIPFNDLSQTVQDLLTNTSALFDTEVIISDVYLKRYAAGRLMISKVE